MLITNALAVSILCAFVMPQGHGSIFHTNWHFVCHFSIMILGGLTYLFKDRISTNKPLMDWMWFGSSFVAYFVIVGYGKNSEDWRWYTQLFALIPLHTFCFYGYKVCSQNWCTRLMTNKVWKWPFFVVAALTLEIYVVQFDIITDKFNTLFPLNWFIVFAMVTATAYILRIMVNLFIQFMGKEPWNWKECLKLN